MVEATSNLTPSQRYAASALFAIALNQAQISQTKPLADDHGGDNSESGHRLTSSGDSISQDEEDLWVHEVSGLLRPVFRCLQIDSSAWHGIEEIAVDRDDKTKMAWKQKQKSVSETLRLVSETEQKDDSVESELGLELMKAETSFTKMGSQEMPIQTTESSTAITRETKKGEDDKRGGPAMYGNQEPIVLQNRFKQLESKESVVT